MNLRKQVSNLILVGSCLLLIWVIVKVMDHDAFEHATFFGYKPFIITSGSMEPEYPVNSFVIIHRVETNTIKLGESIAFYSPTIDAYIFHRIVGVSDAGFITKGDHNEFVDHYIVPFEDVVGIPVFQTKLSVYILSLFHSPIRIVLFCLCIGIVWWMKDVLIKPKDMD